MYVCLRKTPTGFEPDSEQDRFICGKMRVGDFALVKLEQPRNIQHHRKAFALFNLVFNNQEQYDTFEAFYYELKIKAGCYREHVTLEGEIVKDAKSLSITKMDQVEFAMYYDRFIDALIKYFIPGISDAELRRAVENELAGA